MSATPEGLPGAEDRCPVCGGGVWRPAGYAFSRVSDVASAVRECAECGLRGLAEPEPDNGLETLYGDDYYAQGARGRPSWRAVLKSRLEESSLPAARRLKETASILWLPRPAAPGQYLLDVGCGAGHLLVHATRLGWRAEGCELSDATARRARAAGFRCYAGDWATELPPARFHLIVLANVLEHLVQPAPYLNAAARALHPDGTALITLPNFDCDQARVFGGRWWALLPPEHVWYYRPADVARLLERAGLVATAIRTQSPVTGVLSPGDVRAQWRTSRRHGESALDFVRRYARSVLPGRSAPPEDPAPPGLTAPGAGRRLSRSPLYTVECRRSAGRW